MIKQNPFSLYDFLGYFIPGALLIYLYLFITNGIDFEEAGLVFNQNKNFQLENFLFFIIISYSLGHLVNFLSSITIERYANWKYNYPSKYLMNFTQNFQFWKGTFRIRLWKLILVLTIFPVSIFDFILGELLGFKDFYTKKADDYIIEIVKTKGLVLLDQLETPEQLRLQDYDYHRIFAHYVYENSKNHQSKINNYIALYGFLRSMCFITVICIWFMLGKVVYNTYDYSSFNEYFKNNKISIGYLVTLMVVSYIFFMAFMKFYRRYSLENLMLIVIDKDLKTHDDN